MKKQALIVLITGLIMGYFFPAYGQDREIKISVDPRIELLAVVQSLSSYENTTGLITDYNFEYKSEIADYFGQYSDHPAVNTFDAMSMLGFQADAPAAAMLYFSDPPELKSVTQLTPYLNGRAGGEKNLLNFIGQLRDFAQKSNFMEFYEKHSQFYSELVDSANALAAGKGYVRQLEDYYGIKQNSYNIILAPLFHHGGYGPWVKHEDGTMDIYNISGPQGANGGIPIFGDENSFKYLAWHEFSHSFANPLTTAYIELASQYSGLQSPIKDIMSDQSYPSWEIVVNEHIVRAITTRLAYLYNGAKDGKHALHSEYGKGFIYIKGLCRKLEQYENERDKYPSLADFYPELLKAFDQYMDEYSGKESAVIPFMGVINAVYMDKSSAILIVPTHEKDTAAQNRIHEYANIIQTKFYPQSRVISDDEALSEDLSKYSMVVYGTLEGNSYLAKLRGDFPFEIRPDAIITDSTYKGENLRFITNWRNPRNPRKGMVIYTAQRPDEIYYINRVYHGPTDYVIASGKEILRDDFYDKSVFPWTY